MRHSFGNLASANCQCLWFHREGPRPINEQRLSSKERNEKNFKAQRKLVERGRSHGILVYLDKDPIGWCQSGLKDELPRIDNKPEYHKLSLDNSKGKKKKVFRGLHAFASTRDIVIEASLVSVFTRY
jgi:hypothetical protein